MKKKFNHPHQNIIFYPSAKSFIKSYRFDNSHLWLHVLPPATPPSHTSNVVLRFDIESKSGKRNRKYWYSHCKVLM